MVSLKGTKGPVQTFSYTQKLNAILRVHAGQTKASVARDIGVPESTLRGWCKKEEKIKYHAKQESVESVGCSKKRKLEEPAEEPLDLSLKRRRGSYSSYAASDYTKKGDTVSKPVDFGIIGTPKTSNGRMTDERERNRAELARLGVALGLNRQETFMPNANNSSASLTDLSSNLNLLAQWNTMMMQQQQRAMQSGLINEVPAPADTRASGMTSPSVGLLTTVDQEMARQMQLFREMQSFHISVWYWLMQQSIASTGMSCNEIASSSTSPRTTTTGLRENRPILYQQLTKDMKKDHISPSLDNPPDQQDAENLVLNKKGENSEANNSSCAEDVE